jgi:hypothetical protein
MRTRPVSTLRGGRVPILGWGQVAITIQCSPVALDAPFESRNLRTTHTEIRDNLVCATPSNDVVGVRRFRGILHTTVNARQVDGGMYALFRRASLQPGYE